MKIRTGEQLTDALSGELIWRKKELSSLRFLLERAHPGTSEHQAILRGALALLYAHWEGFVKAGGRLYLEYLAYQRLRYRDLAPNFLALSLRRLMRAASASNQIGAHIELTRFFRERLDDNCVIPYKDGFAGQANLTSAVLKEILDTLGLDYGLFITKAVLIDERLVVGRNNIAHGEYLRVDHTDYLELSEQVIIMLNTFKNLIENAVATDQYRAV